MNRDDIIRKFLDLHPDTPIDEKQYAVPLRVISHMLKVSAVTEREACAKVCEKLSNDYENTPDDCADAIRARGQR